MPAQDGKRTRLSDRDLTNLARDGHTPEDIADATGMRADHVRKRLRGLGLGYDGEPRDLTPSQPRRKPVVPWYAEGDIEWMAHAACADNDHGPELWFALPGRHPNAVEAAKAVCAACPVSVKCLEMALRAEAGTGYESRAGIYGGMTVQERMALGSEAVA